MVKSISNEYDLHLIDTACAHGYSAQYSFYINYSTNLKKPLEADNINRVFLIKYVCRRSLLKRFMLAISKHYLIGIWTFTRVNN